MTITRLGYHVTYTGYARLMIHRANYGRYASSMDVATIGYSSAVPYATVVQHSEDSAAELTSDEIVGLEFIK